MSYQPPVMPGYSSQPPIWPPPQQPTPRRSRAMPILVGALVVLVLLAGGLAYYLLRGGKGSPGLHAAPTAGTFAQVGQTCSTLAGYDIEDGGHTLIMTTGTQYVSDIALSCVFTNLGMPAAVKEHVLSTRALDGQQTDSWGKYTARWTYHPDDGLRMTIREA